ncbi:MAG: hypothetical protein HFH65_06170 [Lachnospiraceae bacterium]|nr:hypothetical protein [Lachnospiraceae bacterium]
MNSGQSWSINAKYGSPKGAVSQSDMTAKLSPYKWNRIKDCRQMVSIQ